MKTLFAKLALSSLLVMSLMTSASAEEYLLSQETYEALESAQQQMADERYQPAEAALLKLIDETDAGSYERAVVLQTLGYLYSETGDYPRATEQFRSALELNALPPEVTHNLQYNLAQLLIADGKYQQGVDLLTRWLANEANPDTNVYVLLATAHYQLKQFSKTVEHIRTAIRRTNSPKEDWYRMQLAAHIEMKQYDSAINVLETLLVLHPDDKTYWDQLGSLYARQDKQLSSLAVSMLMKRLNLGDDDIVMRLSNMYRYLNIPFKSGQLLQKAIDDGVIAANFSNMEKLADSWLAAREADKASAVLEKIRGQDNSGETDLKLARLYVSEEQWQEAVAPLEAATEKLTNSKKGDALLMGGMVQFHLKNLERAESLLKQAGRFDKQRNQAAQWLRHIQQSQPEDGDA
ncbi:tetratricopeptide repeat protein [Methylophaga sp. OBS3]|uniref:tetratricopeptide repeat protein n=1 Tax=Methylophaga sp. OBS3 TaxID=2991934 RepID=UPI002256A78F|nr:tetratricopeptide repeat protein [Methylophaga sp. OBS3]MCX4190608.1 tetratricopeptide repeat protein [Methylophaga sp. OBS3]